jgi:hypothetical protein
LSTVASPSRYEPNVADRALADLDWDALSHDARWTARNLANPLSYGFSRHELATVYGRTPHWVSMRMAALRKEIRQQVGVPTAREIAGRQDREAAPDRLRDLALAQALGALNGATDRRRGA